MSSPERDAGNSILVAEPPLLAALSKANGVVAASLRLSIQLYAKSEDYVARGDGLDFLEVKNGLTISYLIDLVMLLRCRLNGNNNCLGSNGEMGKQCMERLLEMKTALEKIRPLEKRMRYQIDKLLALSTLDAGSFAVLASEDQDEDGEEEAAENVVDGEKDCSVSDDGQDQVSQSDDPLSFKPDLKGMMKIFEDVQGDNGETIYDVDGTLNAESDDSGRSDILSSKPEILLEKDDDDGSLGGVYQPPRLQSVPFQLDSERKLAKEQRLLRKQRERLSRSELAAVIRGQFDDTPEVEDVHGGATTGAQSEEARKIAMRDADRGEFEEAHMVRLSVGKKEKRERKRLMREEMSNLGVIADGLGSVAAGVDDAFGGSVEVNDDYLVSSRLSDGDCGGSSRIKGMRKRRLDVLDHQLNSGSRGCPKKKGALNKYQKSLYGGGGDGGKKPKKKKKN